MARAGIEVRAKGPLFDGRASRVVEQQTRKWLQGVLRYGRDYARSVAPVLTGTFRSSIVYRTRIGRAGIEGEVASGDVLGKVKVIERGFPARPLARQTKKGAIPTDGSFGPTLRYGKGRKGVFVFRRTFSRMEGLFASQSRSLAADISKELRA